jgi:hypothetical protein
MPRTNIRKTSKKSFWTLNSSDSPVPPGAPEELQRTILREAHDALYNDKWNVCAGRLSLFLSLIMSLIISLSL